jgi:hypothetical protein
MSVLSTFLIPRISGLVSHWKFDEGTGTSATDSSGRGNNGTLTNGPVWTTGKNGVGALQFDGVNDYVGVPTDPVDVHAVTVCAWIYTSNPNSFGAILCNSRFLFGTYVADAKIALYSNTSGSGPLLSTTNSLLTNTWQHICVTRNAGSGGAAQIYINGVLNASGNSGTPVTGFGLGIGASPFLENLWAGRLDDVRVYNRILTAAEIAWIYSSPF